MAKKKIEQDPDNPIVMLLYNEDDTTVSVGCSSKWLVKQYDNLEFWDKGLQFILGVKVTINGKRLDIFTDVDVGWNEDSMEEFSLGDIKAEDVNCSIDFNIPIYINDTFIFHGFIYGKKVPERFHINVFDVTFWNFDTKKYPEMGTYELFPDKHVQELKEK